MHDTAVILGYASTDQQLAACSLVYSPSNRCSWLDLLPFHAHQMFGTDGAQESRERFATGAGACGRQGVCTTGRALGGGLLQEDTEDKDPRRQPPASIASVSRFSGALSDLRSSA